MKKPLVLLVLALTVVLTTTSFAKYSGGTGTELDPYLISTPEDMNAIGADSNDWGSHFKLMNDIDLSGYMGTDFNIIGSGWSAPFTGVFDGNGYKIYNFSYGPTGTDSYIGIFGMVYGPNAEIRNLGLINCNITAGDSYSGSLVGRLANGIINNCYIEGGSIIGDDFVGGLVGYNGFLNAEIINCYAKISVSGDWAVGGLTGINDGTITNCYATGSVVGNTEIGGLVGSNEELATISNCYSTGIVEGPDNTGGLAGRNFGGTILNCYSNGDVLGENYSGGLAGKNSGANDCTATISNSYATGDVSGNYVVGGLVGWHTGFLDPAVISNCYSTGKVSDGTNVGGLLGWNLSGSVSSAFWDKITSGKTSGVGSGSSSGITGEITSNMQKESTFTNVGWDFVDETTNGPNDIWKICDGTNYPKLAWQIPIPGDFICPDGVGFDDLEVLTENWLLPVLAGDLEKDGFVDLYDFAIFANAWQSSQGSPNWNSACDIAPDGGDGFVGLDDLVVFIAGWLQVSATAGDIAPAPADKFVNFLDFAVFAENWL
ncbi:MAG: GLUG motif-containing protein, partial [Planctomycetota bacterium]